MSLKGMIKKLLSPTAISEPEISHQQSNNIVFGSDIRGDLIIGPNGITVSGGNFIEGSGLKTSKKLPHKDFTQIRASGSFHITHDPSTEGVEVIADDNLHEFIQLEISASSLSIGFVPGSSIVTKEPIKIICGSQRLSSVELSGACQLDAVATNVDCIGLKISGSSTVRIEGRSNEAKITTSGSSKVAADMFFCSKLTVNTSGASLVTGHALDNLDACSSGASQISIHGLKNSAVINRKNSGASSINTQNGLA